MPALAELGASTQQPLRIAGFSFADGGGGAAKAAYRLHSEMRTQGQNATLNVLRKTSSDPSVTDVAKHSYIGAQASEISPRLDQLPIRLLYPSSKSFLSTGWHGAVNPASLPGVTDADVLMLYWVARGVVSIKHIGNLLATGKPIIWRLSDMWPFTGGCHYSQGCDHYRKMCGNCPQLTSRRSYDLTNWLLKLKHKHWKDGQLTIVSPSNWMAREARASSLFSECQIRVIPTGVDCGLFQPLSQLSAREKLKLPIVGQFVLFGATSVNTDARKGGEFFVQAYVDTFSSSDNPPHLIVFGSKDRPSGIPEHLPVHCLGVIEDEAMLPLVYSACDYFVAPSREENLANTVLESLACGVPVVATNVGGMPDAIENEHNGLLVQANDTKGMARALNQISKDFQSLGRMSKRSRETALEKFSLVQQAQSYIKLARELLD